MPGDTSALGWAVAAAVHLAVGSPGGLPSLHRVQAGLAGLGVDAEVLGIESRRGVVWAHARERDGRELGVKIYGRDAWDGQLIVSVWRFLWFRDGGPTLSLTRLQQVEHEAFLTLLADARGVPVAGTVAAGLDAGGDAQLVTERVGRGRCSGDRRTAGRCVDDGGAAPRRRDQPRRDHPGTPAGRAPSPN